MKIVIDIPKEVYDFIKDRGHLPYAVSLANAIKDGEILPDNHGDLIDRDIEGMDWDDKVRDGMDWEDV